MSSEWLPFTDLLSAIVDNRGRTCPVGDSGIPLIATNCIDSSSLYPRYDTTRFVSDETYETWFRGHPKSGDILFVCKGSPGRTNWVPDPVDFCIAQDMVAVRADPAKIYPKYLFAALRSSVVQTQIDNMHVGTMIPHFKKGDFGKLSIPVPSQSAQYEIGDFYFSISERITLLRETNTTLEAIAQALFKSWFVDFDPVHAKMQGRAPEGMDEATAALFPDSFEDSEQGPVPKGWTQSPLGNFCSVTIGGLWGKDDQEETDLVPAISLRGVDLEHLRAYGFAPDAPLRWVKASAMEKRRLTASQVLIASSGAGPCGRPLWAGGPLEEMYGLPVIFSNFVKRLECGSVVRALYVDRLLAAMRENTEIWNFINGTSIPNLDDKLLLDTKQVVMPPDLILEAFANVLQSIYNKLYGGQAVTLAALRDTLLPRLISGQLRLPDAQAIAESA